MSPGSGQIRELFDESDHFLVVFGEQFAKMTTRGASAGRRREDLA